MWQNKYFELHWRCAANIGTIYVRHACSGSGPAKCGSSVPSYSLYLRFGPSTLWVRMHDHASTEQSARTEARWQIGKNISTSCEIVYVSGPRPLTRSVDSKTEIVPQERFCRSRVRFRVRRLSHTSHTNLIFAPAGPTLCPMPVGHQSLGKTFVYEVHKSTSDPSGLHARQGWPASW